MMRPRIGKPATRSCCGRAGGIPPGCSGWTRFAEDRARFADLPALGHYQRVRDGQSPEWQADFYADTTGPLPDQERPMVDVETGVSDPAEFLRRWLIITSPASGAAPQCTRRCHCGTRYCL
ncbi:MAG TPA: hypothetical protein VFO16_08680 [Pseudonocardiaceae bacterium]|nr:hypothetical protein [Pseudonocardiaceae bacterium]